MIKKIISITLALITVFAMMSISMTSASAATKVSKSASSPQSITVKNSITQILTLVSLRLTTISRLIIR